MDMTDQPRLWTPAVDAVVFNMSYRWPDGWTVHMAFRRNGDRWGHEPTTMYTELCALELVDVVDAELLALLGL